MIPERIQIEDRISYWRATEEPLSADIGVIEGDEYIWIFDVGDSEDAVKCVQSLPGRKGIILSHFHQDHIGNWNKLDFYELYQGDHTFRYTKTGQVVRGHIEIEDGVKLHLFELPSSHAKGSIGLEVNEKYAFIGDATYCSLKNGKPAYNANLLAEEIKTLRVLKADYLLLSHDKRFLRPKRAVLKQLESIYAGRDPQSAYIFV